MTQVASTSTLPELDLRNPRRYLMMDLFDSDSDSDSDSEEEMVTQSAAAVKPAPTSTPQSIKSQGQRRESIDPRIGGVAPVTASNSKEDEAEIEAYEMAALRKKEKNEGDASPEQAKPTALQSDRSIQDSLSGELLRMAGILKANSMAFADALERDRQILEQAGEKLQGNLTLMTRTRGKLGEYSRKARGMGWLTLGSVAVVCASWVVMFVLIRLT
jgi:hypothetical protein